MNKIYIGGIKMEEKIDIMNEVAEEMEDLNMESDNKWVILLNYLLKVYLK